ncbi:maltokinase N-terminal cap-like domain-containing protein [Aureimonas sp. AU40]|uniref:maltokinase N-terminal cap-like domain-containing protein n=1 Tax=Aureimonas sp. AU40 TaxID=1637747 RepID=UPI0007803A09|nr:phosphotransferase [Aureimonas sp. AU40]
MTDTQSKPGAGAPDMLPAFGRVASLSDLVGADGAALEAALRRFLQQQRWFAAKSERLDAVSFAPLGVVDGAGDALAGEAVVRTTDGEQRYFLPLALCPRGRGVGANLLAELEGERALVDATRDPDFCRAVVALIAAGGRTETGGGALRATASAARAEQLREAVAVDPSDIAPLSGEQSNTSIGIGRVAILKFYRLLRDGEQPELEVTSFLTENTGFTAAPALLGSLELSRADGSRAAVAALFERIGNAGDAWASVTGSLAAHLRAGEGGAAAEFAFDPGRTIGRRTGEMHAALASETGDAAFDPEPLDRVSLARIVDEAKHEAAGAIALLRGVEGGADVAADIAALGAREGEIARWFESFKQLEPAGRRTRIHGDYHLGQLLVRGDDIVILDFEGEPGRPLPERRAKTSPLRDVAGMLRSYDYAAFAALDALRTEDPALAERARDAAERWRDETSASFLSAWESASGVDLADEGNARLLDLFLLQKAFYELRYEAAMRPAWLSIPLRGIVSLLQKRQVL